MGQLIYWRERALIDFEVNAEPFVVALVRTSASNSLSKLNPRRKLIIYRSNCVTHTEAEPNCNIWS